MVFDVKRNDLLTEKMTFPFFLFTGDATNEDAVNSVGNKVRSYCMK